MITCGQRAKSNVGYLTCVSHPRHFADLCSKLFCRLFTFENSTKTLFKTSVLKLFLLWQFCFDSKCLFSCVQANWNMSMLQTEDVLKSAQASMEKKSPKAVVFSKLWKLTGSNASVSLLQLWACYCIVTASKPESHEHNKELLDLYPKISTSLQQRFDKYYSWCVNLIQVRLLIVM